MALKQAGLVDVVERCYALEIGSSDAWLRGVFDAATRLLDEGRGAMAVVFDARGPVERWRLERPMVHGFPEAIADATLAGFAAMPPVLKRSLYQLMGPVGTYAQATGRLISELPDEREREIARRVSVVNFAVVNGTNPDGRGASLMFATHADTRRSPATHPHLARIGSHVAAGFRLVTALSPPVAAVFEPSGKPVQIDAPEAKTLRAKLRDAVRRQDRARGRLRRTDQREALRIWEALVAGRYSLVDRFESDGRRYVVAHENAPSAPDPRGLTADERVVAGWVAQGHSDKLIAYELGRPEGTIRAITHRVLRKLGARTRLEIVRALSRPDAATTIEVSPGVVAMRWTDRAQRLRRLTAAEREVARLVIEGKSTRELAALRGRSPRTIDNQLASIYRKLGISTRSELAAMVSS